MERAARGWVGELGRVVRGEEAVRVRRERRTWEERRVEGFILGGLWLDGGVLEFGGVYYSTTELLFGNEDCYLLPSWVAMCWLTATTCTYVSIVRA